MWKSAALGVIAFAVLATPASAEHLYPRNECTHLEGVDAFRMTLSTAVANRNAEMLQSIVDPDIMLDFGGGSGWEEFRARLESEQRGLWGELQKTIALGCAADSDFEMAFPWLWSQNLGTDDPFSAFVSLGTKVPLRSEPRANAPLVRYLNWEVVTLTGPYNPDQTYLEVSTRTGDKGFVLFDQLRSEIDYRLLVFRDEESGAWRITHFIAGD